MEAAQSERDEGNKVIPGSEYCDDGLELINEDHANEADDDEYSSEDKTCNEKSEVSSEEEVTDDVGTNITTTVMNVERTTANGNQQRMISIDSKISKVRSNDCNYEENILGSNDVSSIMQNSENCSPRTLVPLRTYSIESIEALASSNAELSPGTLLKEESGSSLVFHNDDKNVVVDTCSRIGDHEKGDINGEYREKANDKSSISGSVDDDVIVEYEDIKNVYEEGVGEINTEVHLLLLPLPYIHLLNYISIFVRSEFFKIFSSILHICFKVFVYSSVLIQGVPKFLILMSTYFSKLTILRTLPHRSLAVSEDHFLDHFSNTRNVHGPRMILYCYQTPDIVSQSGEQPFLYIKKFLEYQKELGREVDEIMFNDSPHVMHYKFHPDEYRSACISFMNRLEKRL
uniref:FSH1 domain-containing protein n=1 Tax=Heterorhabditis bacteriophora TaxID=37862 RepID=A0A1I7WVH1_HETBA